MVRLVIPELNSVAEEKSPEEGADEELDPLTRKCRMERSPKVAFPGRSPSSTSEGTFSGTATTVVLSDC